ncbi:MAG: DUF882 domain-containing protein [Labilithrix sp.]|nr:DUF882 domain-containing protein [Labilithrix sp.]
MKPVVSSFVALAIAIAPLAAMASPEKSSHAKPAAVKVVKHKKVEKASKASKVEKGSKKDNPIVHVKHTKKPSLKPIVHHAHGVDTSGAGHKEPKIEKGVHVMPASMTSKVEHGKTAHAKPGNLPKLPAERAALTKVSSKEKGARKAVEKKSEPDDGKLERDGELAELVARIRGKSKSEPKPDAKRCAKDPIEIIRGPEIETFALTKCDGTLAPLAIEHLSVLVRPGSAARPTTPIAELAQKKGAELAPGVRRVDERLAMRIQLLADHFGKAGSPMKLSIVSGYRPMSVGSMHATGRAIDFRIEGTKNEDVVSFCKTLTDTGCGYYPNSSFVHLDVRDPGAGHVSWIDASGPGETPRYVTAWPPRPTPIQSRHEDLESVTAKEPAEKLDREAAPEIADEHPAEVAK